MSVEPAAQLACWAAGQRVRVQVTAISASGMYGTWKTITAMEVEMASRSMITLEDDLDGGPAEETVRFGLGGA